MLAKGDEEQTARRGQRAAKISVVAKLQGGSPAAAVSDATAGYATIYVCLWWPLYRGMCGV